MKIRASRQHPLGNPLLSYCSASSGHEEASTGRAEFAIIVVLAHAVVPAACIWWKNHGVSPIPTGKEDAGNSMAKFQALTVQWEAIQPFLVFRKESKNAFYAS